MPNYPSIYLELQELWKRIRLNDADIIQIKQNIIDIQGDTTNIFDRISCITHSTDPYERTIISCSLEQGEDNTASGLYSHAQGYKTTASNKYSHAEGGNTLASGTGSHAEGQDTRAIAQVAHSEGRSTLASNTGSHAEGFFTTASGEYSHAEGLSTIATASYQHVQGRWNATSSNALMLIGNGTGDGVLRSNILEVHTSSIVLSPAISDDDVELFVKDSGYNLNIIGSKANDLYEQGGDIGIVAGDGYNTGGSGGNIILQGGTAGTIAGFDTPVGGNIYLQGGSSSAGDGGNIYIRSGQGIMPGKVYIDIAQPELLAFDLEDPQPNIFIGSSSGNTAEVQIYGPIYPAEDANSIYAFGLPGKRWHTVFTKYIKSEDVYFDNITVYTSSEFYEGARVIQETGSWSSGYVGIELSGSGLYDATGHWRLALYQNNLTFNYYTGSSWVGRAYLTASIDVGQLDFTGQHRSQINNLTVNNSTGLIVKSDGVYSDALDGGENNIKINEAIPKISLVNKRKDKSVFGVVSGLEDSSESRNYSVGAFVTIYNKQQDDNRVIVNSLGEGGIWVCNINGNFENGDYITSCEIPGYGMKQDDDLLHNYTVAKITCDCDFNLSSSLYKCEEFQFSGSMYRKAFVGCTYHCG